MCHIWDIVGDIMYGETIKQLRKSKNFLMKEVYGGILSRSTAHRFENNMTNTTVENLLNILGNLGIYSFDEFLFIHKKRRNQSSLNIDRLLEIIIKEKEDNNGNNKFTRQFYEVYKNSPKQEEIFYAYIAHLDILMNENSTSVSLPSQFQNEYEFIQNYLTSIESWTLRELELFPFVSICFNEDGRNNLLKTFKKNYVEYKDYIYNWQEAYTNHLINFSMHTLRLEKYQDLSEELREIEELFRQYPRLEWNLINKCRFLILLISISTYKKKKTDVNANLEKLAKCIKSISNSEDELASFYTEYAHFQIGKISSNNNK